MMTEAPARAAEARPSGPRCLLCGGGSLRVVFSELPWVVECGACRLRFSSPQPDDHELESIYDEHYYEQFGFVEGGSGARGLARTKKATYRRVLQTALPHIRSEHRRLLDVGCGLGFSLLAAQEIGFDAVGLEPLAPSDPALRPGRRILKGTLESFVAEQPFDVVSMIDVIEHVRDPIATCVRAAALLREGGVLVLATNDSSSPGARLMGSRWTHYHRAHLWFFTPESLGRVVRAAGLELVLTRGAQRVYNLEYIASILARGTNFPAASLAARAALALAPGPLARAAWPPLPEGFTLVARKLATEASAEGA